MKCAFRECELGAVHLLQIAPTNLKLKMMRTLAAGLLIWVCAGIPHVFAGNRAQVIYDQARFSQLASLPSLNCFSREGQVDVCLETPSHGLCPLAKLRLNTTVYPGWNLRRVVFSSRVQIPTLVLRAPGDFNGYIVLPAPQSGHCNQSYVDQIYSALSQTDLARALNFTETAQVPTPQQCALDAARNGIPPCPQVARGFQ